MTDIDVHGPIDYLLLEFPDQRPTGATAAALRDLVAGGLVRVYDLLLIRKDDDGTVSGIELTDLSDEGLGGFRAFAAARSGLLGDDDLDAAAAAMEPSTVAVLLVYENTWAIPFVAAAREAGGEVIASERIPATDVMRALELLESLEPAS